MYTSSFFQVRQSDSELVISSGWNFVESAAEAADVTDQIVQWGWRLRSFHFMLLYFAAPANGSDCSAAVMQQMLNWAVLVAPN